MFEALFGAEMPLSLRYFIAFVIVLGFVSTAAWIFHQIAAERRSKSGATRGRLRRLAVIDAAPIGGRRRLILIRRDNVEHLLIIGGPTDTVVEANIVRASAAQRDPIGFKRVPTTSDTLPRVVPLGDNDLWPLQPEPNPETVPVAGAKRTSITRVQPESVAPPPASRERRPIDPLVGFAAELLDLPTLANLGGSATYAAASPATREPTRDQEAPFESEQLREPEAVRQAATVLQSFGDQEPNMQPEAAPVSEPEIVQKRGPALTPTTDPEILSNADRMAKMAQRLEAQLRRPGRFSKAPPPPTESGARSPALEPISVVEPSDAQIPLAPGPSTSQKTDATRPGPKPSMSLYASLEKEMALVLGYPNEKS